MHACLPLRGKKRMQGKKKKRLIVTLHYTFIFKVRFCKKGWKLPWFLSPLRGDGKQSWYPKRSHYPKRRRDKSFAYKRKDNNSYLFEPLLRILLLSLRSLLILFLPSKNNNKHASTQRFIVIQRMTIKRSFPSSCMGNIFYGFLLWQEFFFTLEYL